MLLYRIFIKGKFGIFYYFLIPLEYRPLFWNAVSMLKKQNDMRIYDNQNIATQSLTILNKEQASDAIFRNSWFSKPT